MNVLDRLIEEACRCKKCSKLPQECECHLPLEEIKSIATGVAMDLDHYLMTMYPDVMARSRGFRPSLKNHLASELTMVLKEVFRARPHARKG
jgi:hypothetical protein